MWTSILDIPPRVVLFPSGPRNGERGVVGSDLPVLWFSFFLVCRSRK